MHNHDTTREMSSAKSAAATKETDEVAVAAEEVLDSQSLVSSPVTANKALKIFINSQNR